MFIKEVDKIEVIAGVALAFGVAGTVLGATGTGLGLNAAGITFKIIGDKIGGFLQRTFSKIHMFNRATGRGYADIFRYLPLSVRTNFTPLETWGTSEYESLADETFTDDWDDPEKCAITLSGAEEMCNQFRDSLKPAFKLLVDRVEEISTDIVSIDFSGCVQKSDLVRDDINDIVCSSRTKYIILTAEDTINNGIIKIKVFISGKDPLIFSITFEDNEITEFKGINETPETFRTEH